jgi:hypothetical protein
MSENKTQEGIKGVLSQDEKIEFLKTIFSTLEVDYKAVFTQWCHEELERGAGELLGHKMQKVNDKFTAFVAKASDQVNKGVEFVCKKTNEAFEPKEEGTVKNNSDTTGDGKSSFFD